MRPVKELTGRKFVIGRYLFFRDHVKKAWWNWIFFYYALFGYILARIVILIVSPGKDELARLRGIFSAVRDIFRGHFSI